MDEVCCRNTKFDNDDSLILTMQSFWQPQDTPDSDIRAEKPSADVLCPISGKKLRMKDLTVVKFTPADEGKDGVYMDPISLDVLRNSSKLVVLKPTGDVVLEKTYTSCIKPDGVYKGMQLPTPELSSQRVFLDSLVRWDDSNSCVDDHTNSIYVQDTR